MATTQTLFLLLQQESQIGVSTIPSGEYFYLPEIIHSIVTSGFIDSGIFYEPTISQPIAVTTAVFGGEEFYVVDMNPVMTGNAFYDGEFLTFEVTSSLAVTTTTVIDDSEVYHPLISPGALILDTLSVINAGQFYTSAVTASAGLIYTTVIDDGFFYISEVLAPAGKPLVFRSPVGFGGRITANDIAPSLSYYDIPQSTPLSQGLLSYAQAYSIIPNYISSVDAVFGTEMYRGLYVMNPASSPSEAQNIYFWINGGETFSMKNAATPNGVVVKEGSKYLDTTELDGSFSNDGVARTSLFGQVDIGVYVSPIRELNEFSSNGVGGGGFDLSRQNFQPANTRIRLPDLSPDEYVGVYLKMVTKFNPAISKMKDYSFLHLSYTSLNGEVRETYPGQLRTIPPASYDLSSNVLPSVVLKFTTNYGKLMTNIEETVVDLYNKYPPFFLSYEDS